MSSFSLSGLCMILMCVLSCRGYSKYRHNKRQGIELCLPKSLEAKPLLGTSVFVESGLWSSRR
jgi:hypothetical protein